MLTYIIQSDNFLLRIYCYKLYVKVKKNLFSTSVTDSIFRALIAIYNSKNGCAIYNIHMILLALSITLPDGTFIQVYPNNLYISS